MSIDVKSWAKKYKELTEKDETIKAMAKYYTCSFLFDMGSVKVIIEMHDGKVKNINTNPGGLDPYDFALGHQSKHGESLQSLFQNLCFMVSMQPHLEKTSKLRVII